MNGSINGDFIIERNVLSIENILVLRCTCNITPLIKIYYPIRICNVVNTSLIFDRCRKVNSSISCRGGSVRKLFITLMKNKYISLI